MKDNTENRLRLSATIADTVQAMRDSLTEGTLGKHLTRFYVPHQIKADMDDGFTSVLSLAGIKDGKALFEIRPHERARAQSGGSHDFSEYRRGIQAQFIDKPWLRALVPLKGDIAGSVIQLRQPPMHRAALVGFIFNHQIDRRGGFTRHTEHHDVGNGAVQSMAPAINVCHSPAYQCKVVVPIDRYLGLKLVRFDAKEYHPIAFSGVLRPTSQLSARRVERRQMRDAALDYIARIGTAVSVLDLSTGDPMVNANALQDILGLTDLKQDYHYRSELEVASGRLHYGSHGFDMGAEYAAAVLVGALHSSARSEFFSSDDASLFITAVKSFTKILQAKEDRVFQANTMFSSAPSPDNTTIFEQLHEFANGDIQSI